jgi:N4-gp56 family major capsid protein
MAIQSYSTDTPRIGKMKGMILAHAEAKERLSKTGRQVQMPKNNSDTYVARRFLPYGATATNATTQNQFFQAGNGDRSAAMVQANQIAEGVTPSPDSLIAVDITVVLIQYGCLYGFTDKTFLLYEDDIPDEMMKQIGERVTLVNEQIVYGALKACTNQFYGGTGTSISTVNGAITLGMVRKIVKNLQANHAEPINSVLSSSQNFDTSAVPEGFSVYCSSDMSPDIRDLPNFVSAEKYASGKPMPYELGMCENFRFIWSPDLPSLQNAGASVGSTGLASTSGSLIDVYQFIVAADNAWSQIAVRGRQSLETTYLPTGKKDKADPLGQRGYAGTAWWKAVMVENPGWMAVGNVGVKTLT